MAWTTTDLSKIEEAIASGTKVVQYENKRVEYHSLKEMLQVRDLIMKALGLTTSTKNRIKTQHSKGFDE